MIKLIVFFMFLMTGCADGALVKADADIDVPIDAKIEGKVAEKMVAVDKSVTKKTSTKQTAGGDAIAGGIGNVNDTEMIKDMIEQNEKLNEKLINSYSKIINILIIQMCALLVMFIRKDYNMRKLSQAATANMDKMQMDLIEKLAVKK